MVSIFSFLRAELRAGGSGGWTKYESFYVNQNEPLTELKILDF